MNLSSLANKLANIPQTLNVIICDYQMKNKITNFIECSSDPEKQCQNPGLSLIFHSRSNEKELSFYIRQMLDEMKRTMHDNLDDFLQSMLKFFDDKNQVIDPI